MERVNNVIMDMAACHDCNPESGEKTVGGGWEWRAMEAIAKVELELLEFVEFRGLKPTIECGIEVG